jgi:hypothetical protein
MMVGDQREIILLLRKPRSKWFHLCCIGRKRHYRKDGTCKHTAEVLARIKPEVRPRVIVDRWGGKTTDGAKRDEV